MRALVVTNLYPSPSDPARGSFVRDQVRALARLPGIELELFTFALGGAAAYPRAARDLRRRYRGGDFDIVHAHFGLTAWPALAVRGARHVVTLHGTDLVHPRSRAITLAALPFVDLAAPVSDALAATVPRRLARRVSVLPCGADLRRFQPCPRVEARRALGLAPDRRYLLFPADPVRTEKRIDRARALVEGLPGTQLLTLGHVAPEEVPLWVNAADAVLVTSERESFGLAVVEALACDVPVMATDVGIAPEALAGVAGTFCGPWDLERWRAAATGVLGAEDPRVAGRVAAERYSADRLAQRVAEAWRSLL